ncbi:non-ribosomal peptide synthetase [Ferribacterium limneticum]|uniref:non-ribosomal peptide synthetase n=1 Tax=Ferribacterium limneticum TaxID=76259 RepID=UPI001CF97D44|nr:non-ribosomal peptide synthetase [Ferribacterium limneticum]UCV30320.1 amino acid adenylation domain-containing protein [Ferribacterium limneticum]UCV34238.1 amino acid adenylation domain-containing protein [Ferribacterium limneticum]
MTKPDIQAIHRLTPLQEGMLFHALSAPQSGVYVEQFACRAPGVIECAGWEAAWNHVLAAYPVLRSAIAWEGLEQPLQVMLRQTRLEVREIDARGDDDAAFAARLEALQQEQARQGFDLRTAPLLRQILLQRADASVVFWCYHHIILDGWSAFVVLGEVLAAYMSSLAGQAWHPREAASYADYLAWQQVQDGAAAENYWRPRLAGFAVATTLGLVERHDGETVSDAGATVVDHLGEALAGPLRDYARAARITVGTVLQAAWAYTLAIYSGENDVVFGVTVSGRPPELPGTEAMVGLFINTVPCRVQVDPAQTAGEFVAALQRQLLAQREFEHVALPRITQWSDVPRGQPLFDSMLAIESFPYNEQVSLADVTVWQQTNFPLALVVDPVGEMRVKALFDPRRHAPAAIARLLGHFAQALRALIEQPTEPLGTLSLQPADDARRQAGWNHLPAVGEAEVDMATLFARQVARRPEATAVVAGEEKVSYAALDRASRRYAARLLATGVRPGQTVAFAFEPGADMIAALIGITRLGCAYAPLDPRLPTLRLHEMLADLAIHQVICGTEYAALFDLPGITVHLPEAWSDNAPIVEVEPPAARHLLYVIHTSGSTGKPKAAGVYHDSFVRFIQWWNRELALTEADRCLLINKITFDLAQKCVWGALTTGGELHLAPTRHFDPLAARELTQAQAVSWINCTPSMAYALAEVAEDPAAAFTSLRLLLVGGEPVDKRRLANWLLDAACHTELVNTYGPTECTDLCNTHRFSGDEFIDLARPVTVGRVLPGLAVHVLDRFGNKLPCGVTGEVVIAGGSVGCGYLNNAAMSAEKFSPDPEAGPGERRYYTGDRGYFNEDGTLIVRGRTDFQVKLRGYRIELDAIGHELRGHPAVRDACAVVSSDGQRLVAYVVTDAEQPWTPELQAACRAHLAARLPDYMVPAIFMPLAVLPLNANGKLDRAALPEPQAGEAASERVAPSTDSELKLAAIWARILGHEDFGIHDNFFELGGHSLSITQVYSRLNKVFGVRIPLALLFEQPTIAQQAAALDVALAAAGAMPGSVTTPATPEIVPQERPARIPLSFAQSRLWFLHQYDPSSLAYHVPNALRLPGEVDRAALAAALAWLHERHEALRTSFPEADGMAWQHIAAPGPVALAYDDLRGDPAADDKLGEIAGLEAAGLFDLHNGPVARYHLVQCDDEAVLLMTLHHIATDGWSMDLLVRDLSAAYAALAAGRQPAAAPLPVQYADYTLWQQATLSGQRLDDEVAFWRDELAGSNAQIALPYDHARPPVQSVAGRLHVTHIDADTAAAMRQFGQAAGATEFMTWLALYDLLLQRWSGQDDFNVGSPVANRTHVEIEELIGFFVNTLVLRARTPATASFEQLLRDTRDTAHRAFEHPDLPFELLVDRLNPERHPGYQPFFQVGFALQRAYEDTSLLGGDDWIARFDLQLIIYFEADGSLRAHWEYASALFAPETIARLAESFADLARQVLANPSRPLGCYGLLPPAAAMLLDGWNDTARPLPPLNVHQLVEARVRLAPDAVALIGGDGRTLSYAQLNERANRLAHYLRDQGTGLEQPVGVCLDRCPELIVALLAILKAGGAYVPLDPAYPADRLAFMLDDSDVRLVITRSDLGSLLPASAKRLNVDLEQQLIEPMLGIDPAPLASPDNLAYILYTSGSTGQPKGVMVEHRAIVRLICETGYARFAADERFLQFAPVAFDASTFEIWGSLCHGATLVQAPAGLLALDELAALIEREKVTTAWLTAALFNAMVDHHGHALRGLRQLLTGGDVISLAHATRAIDLLDNGRLIHCYGPTETTTFATCHTVSRADIAAGVIPIGQPIANTTCHVLNRALQPQPVGVEGELYIGGAGVARGYHRQPELTAERFIANPFDKAGGRLYRSGDRVRWRADGSLEFLGRVDFQIKLRGYRIEPGEIEAALCRHPEVKEALVLLVGNDVDKRLVAYCLSDTAQPETLGEALRQHLSALLPPFMVPGEFIVLATWPINANGKIDRGALPQPGQRQEEAYVAPETDTEHKVAAVWAELLGCERVSVTADFFALGGNSLSATQLLARIRVACGRSVTIPVFFAEPTVRAMARHLDAAERGDTVEDLDRPVDGDAESIIELPEHLPPVASSLEQVLLTGATGFLGAYLVARILERWPQVTLHCHVRARDEAAGLARLVANLEQYGLWQPHFAPRLRILIADLDAPRCGLDDAAWQELARGIDLIVHNASLLNHVLPYAALKQANVEPTRQLLALALEHKLKGFMYVSTAGVLHGDGKGRTVDEDIDIESEPQEHAEGYNASKWVAELMVRRAARAGLPAQIARLGRVVIDSSSGGGRLDDFVALFIRTCLRLNAYPDYPITEQIVPVDYLGEAVVALAGDYTCTAVHHLVGEESRNWSKLLPDFVDCERAGLVKIPIREWVDRVKQSSIDDPLPFAPYLFWWDTDATEPEEKRLKIKSQRTVRALERVGVKEPKVATEAWTNYLKRLFADEGREFHPRRRRLF